MKITAVIITYNRLPLLKKCLTAVNQQTYKPDEIIIVNNGSTDQTSEFLKEQQQLIVHTQENSGGAGGFASGIKLAYTRGADWIWLMDDDTIPLPYTLKNLISALGDLGSKADYIGFLSSKVLWTDSSIHEMNRTYVLKDKSKLKKLSVSDSALPLIQFGTFVSMLVSAKAVERVGLPIKEYFIWNDDVEYSKRIIKSGLAGILIDESVAVHETPINHLSSVFKDSSANLWKYRYGLRNELYSKLLHDGQIQFFVTCLHRMFIMPFRILINRKNDRWKFIKVIWKSSLEAVFFRPVIEKVDVRP